MTDQKSKCLAILNRRKSDYLEAAKFWQKEENLESYERCLLRSYVLDEAIRDIERNVL